jgi:hypothetical protein
MTNTIGNSSVSALSQLQAQTIPTLPAAAGVNLEKLSVREYVASLQNAKTNDLARNGESTAAPPHQLAKELLARLGKSDGLDFSKILKDLTWNGKDISEIWKKIEAFIESCKTSGVTAEKAAALVKDLSQAMGVDAGDPGKVLGGFLGNITFGARKASSVTLQGLTPDVVNNFVNNLANAAKTSPSQSPFELMAQAAQQTGNPQFGQLSSYITAASSIQNALQGKGGTLAQSLQKLGNATGEQWILIAASITDITARVAKGEANAGEIATALSQFASPAVRQITTLVVEVANLLDSGKGANLADVVAKVAGIFGLDQAKAKLLYETLTDLSKTKPDGITAVDLLGSLSKLGVLSTKDTGIIQQVGQLLQQANQMASGAATAKTTKDMVLALASIGGPETRAIAENALKITDLLAAGNVNPLELAKAVVNAFGGDTSKIELVQKLITDVQKAEKSGADPLSLTQKILAGGAKIFGPSAEKAFTEVTRYLSAAGGLTQQLTSPHGASIEGVVLSLGQFFGEDGVKISKALIELKNRLDTGTLDDKSAADLLSRSLGWDAATAQRTITQFKKLSSEGVPSWDAAFSSIRETGSLLGGSLGQVAINAADLGQKFTQSLAANNGNVVGALSSSVDEICNLLAPNSGGELKQTLQNVFTGIKNVSLAKSTEDTLIALASVGGESAEKIARAVAQIIKDINTVGFDVENIARTVANALGIDPSKIDAIKRVVETAGKGITADSNLIEFSKAIFTDSAKLFGPDVVAVVEKAGQFLDSAQALYTQLQQPDSITPESMVGALKGVLGKSEQKLIDSLLDLKRQADAGTLTLESYTNVLQVTLNLPKQAVDNAVALYKSAIKNGADPWETVTKGIALAGDIVGGSVGNTLSAGINVITQFNAASAANGGNFFESAKAAVGSVARLIGGDVAKVTAQLQAGITGAQSFAEKGVIGGLGAGALTQIGAAFGSADLQRAGVAAQKGVEAFDQFAQNKTVGGLGSFCTAVGGLVGSPLISGIGQALTGVQTMASGVANGFVVGMGGVLSGLGAVFGGEVGKVMGQIGNVLSMISNPVSFVLGALSLLTDLFGWGKPPRMAKIGTQNAMYVGKNAEGKLAAFDVTQNGGERKMQLEIKALNQQIVEKTVALRERNVRQGYYSRDLLNNEWSYSKDGGTRVGINAKDGFVVQTSDGSRTLWRANVNPPPGSFMEMNQTTGKMEIYAHASKVIPGDPPPEGYKPTDFVKIWESDRGHSNGGNCGITLEDGGRLEGHTNGGRMAEYSAFHDNGTFGIGAYHRDADGGHTVGTTTYVTKGDYGYFDNANQMMQLLKRGQFTDVAFKAENGDNYVLFDKGAGNFDELTRAQYDARIASLSVNALASKPLNTVSQEDKKIGNSDEQASNANAKAARDAEAAKAVAAAELDKRSAIAANMLRSKQPSPPSGLSTVSPSTRVALSMVG